MRIMKLKNYFKKLRMKMMKNIGGTKSKLVLGQI